MERGKIYTLIPKVMGSLGPVTKGQSNKSQGWAFRGIDDVMNALYPHLTANGVFVVPNVLKETHERVENYGSKYMNYTHLTVEYRFYAEDGSYFPCVVSGEAMDSGDKSTSKALSIAFKYAMFQTFCIPTEEMKRNDPDNDFYGDPEEIKDPEKKAEYEKEVVKTTEEMNDEINKLDQQVCNILKDFPEDKKKSFRDEYMKFREEKSLSEKRKMITALLEKASKAA